MDGCATSIAVNVLHGFLSTSHHINGILDHKALSRDRHRGGHLTQTPASNVVGQPTTLDRCKHVDKIEAHV